MDLTSTWETSTAPTIDVARDGRPAGQLRRGGPAGWVWQNEVGHLLALDGRAVRRLFPGVLLEQMGDELTPALL